MRTMRLLGAEVLILTSDRRLLDHVMLTILEDTETKVWWAGRE